MPRPRKCRKIGKYQGAYFYKPQGVPMSQLQIIELSREEVESLRLKNVLGFEQIQCAKKMHTSQSTFQRILSSANYKVSYALIKGMAIMIEK
jgi:uncharacterized protein